MNNLLSRIKNIPRVEAIVFCSVFSILLTGRMALIGTGCLDDTDELTYVSMSEEYDNLIAFKLERWGKIIYSEDSNPPEVAFRTIQTTFVRAFCRFSGLPPLHPKALYVINMFNVLVSLGILLVFYAILRRLNFSNLSSLLGVFLLGTLVNSNIYVRHILPYDSALLLQLLTVFILISNPVKKRKILIAGACCAIGTANYVGYFMFLFIHIALLLLGNGSPVKKAQRTALFFLPMAVMTLMFEVCSRSIDMSYIKYLLWFSSTVYHGSYSEGLNYVFIYFHLVEKLWGITLLLLFFAGVIYSVRISGWNKSRQFLFLGILSYLIYGCYAYFFHGMVFYGRLLHMYYPFIILGVVVFVDKQKMVSNKILVPALFIAAFINYAMIIKDLNEIAYPRNSIYEQNISEAKGVTISYENELLCGLDYKEREMLRIISNTPSDLKPGVYLLLNFCFFEHYPDSFMQTYHRYEPQKNDSVLFEKKHFMSHPAYTFEYCTKEGRKFFLEKDLKLKIIKFNGN